MAAAACVALTFVGITVNGAIQLLALSVVLLVLLLFGASWNSRRFPTSASSAGSAGAEKASRPDASAG